jgi:hypothetical protein
MNEATIHDGKVSRSLREDATTRSVRDQEGCDSGSSHGARKARAFLLMLRNLPARCSIRGEV